MLNGILKPIVGNITAQARATIDLYAVVMDRQCYLTPKWDVSFSKFMAEATFVGTFQKARPQS